MLLCFYARQGMEGGFPVLLKGKWPVRRALRTWQIQNTPPSCQKKRAERTPEGLLRCRSDYGEAGMYLRVSVPSGALTCAYLRAFRPSPQRLHVLVTTSILKRLCSGPAGRGGGGGFAWPDGGGMPAVIREGARRLRREEHQI